MKKRPTKRVRAGEQEVKTYTIKPLKWKPCAAGQYWYADSAYGTWTIEKWPEGFRWSVCIDEFYDEPSGRCDTLEQAKDSAEAYYRERVECFLVECPNAHP